MTKGHGTSKKKRKRPAAYDVAGRVGELTGTFVRQVLKLTPGELDHWVGKKGVLARLVGDALHAPFRVQETQSSSKVISGPRSMQLPRVEELPLLSGDRWLEIYQRVYWEITGIEPAFQDVAVPENPGGFGWVVAMTQEVSLNTFWQGLRRKFTCWSVYGEDLEGALNWEREQRSYRNGVYTIRVRDRVEADKEHANRSAEWHEEYGTRVITLPERVVLGGLYYVLTGMVKHLDVHNYTLCGGSRGRDGNVPLVGWAPDGRRLSVDRAGVRLALGFIRAREVVS